MNNIIKLNTHDGSNNYLIGISETSNDYILKTACNSIRCMYLEDGRYAIDPSGGPMLIEGDQLPAVSTKARITKISSVVGQGFIISLEK